MLGIAPRIEIPVRKRRRTDVGIHVLLACNFSIVGFLRLDGASEYGTPTEIELQAILALVSGRTLRGDRFKLKLAVRAHVGHCGLFEEPVTLPEKTN